MSPPPPQKKNFFFSCKYSKLLPRLITFHQSIRIPPKFWAALLPLTKIGYKKSPKKKSEIFCNKFVGKNLKIRMPTWVFEVKNKLPCWGEFAVESAASAADKKKKNSKKKKLFFFYFFWLSVFNFFWSKKSFLFV